MMSYFLGQSIDFTNIISYFCLDFLIAHSSKLELLFHSSFLQAHADVGVIYSIFPQHEVSDSFHHWQEITRLHRVAEEKVGIM